MENHLKKTLPPVSSSNASNQDVLSASAVDLPRGYGLLPGLKPVGIIDIGSNSVRLVVYEGATRSPTPLYNEKVLCGLGRSVAASGALDKDALAKTYRALTRFRWLADQLCVERLIVIATAAVRDASNGLDFIAQANEICAVQTRILSGEEEAHYSALGIISGFHDPEGLVGDLGGGSLELVSVRGDALSGKQTLPLGALRLRELSGGSPKKASDLVKRAIEGADIPDLERALPFYAVGGTWRAFAKIHMAVQQYPLSVLQNYRIKAKHAISLAEEIRQFGMRNLPGIVEVSSSRRELLPYGAIVLEQVLKASSAGYVLISALGVREGLLYDLLSPEEAQDDPLLSAAKELCLIHSRSPEHAAELCAWTDRLVEAIRMEEGERDTRLRHAACWLADIGWRAHPDYRGEQTLSKLANAAFTGIDHPGRAFLGLTVFFRHAGYEEEQPGPRLRSLVDLETMGRARTVGAMLRVAYRLSASMPGVLPRVSFVRDDDSLVMQLPPDLAEVAADRISSRFKKLASSVGLSAEIVIQP